MTVSTAFTGAPCGVTECGDFNLAAWRICAGWIKTSRERGHLIVG